MFDLSLHLFAALSLSGAWGLNPKEQTLTGPYPDWQMSFLPIQEQHVTSLETSRLHGNAGAALEPGVDLGRWQLSVPVEVSWLDWRTEGVELSWWATVYTDTVIYRFTEPAVGLSAGRLVGARVRPFASVMGFRWERLHNTFYGEVDELGGVSYHTRDAASLGSGAGLHADLGAALADPPSQSGFSVPQALRFSARVSYLTDGYVALGARITWVFGPSLRL